MKDKVKKLENEIPNVADKKNWFGKKLNNMKSRVP